MEKTRTQLMLERADRMRSMASHVSSAKCALAELDEILGEEFSAFPPWKLTDESRGDFLRPEDIKSAVFKLDLRAEYIFDSVVPAKIESIDDRNGGIGVTATFPDHPDLQGGAVFFVELDGEQFDFVSISCLDPQPGAYETLIGGAIKGVFLALIEHHSRDMEKLRCASAFRAGVGLEATVPAEQPFKPSDLQEAE